MRMTYDDAEIFNGDADEWAKNHESIIAGHLAETEFDEATGEFVIVGRREYNAALLVEETTKLDRAEIGAARGADIKKTMHTLGVPQSAVDGNITDVTQLLTYAASRVIVAINIDDPRAALGDLVPGAQAFLNALGTPEEAAQKLPALAGGFEGVMAKTFAITDVFQAAKSALEAGEG